MNDVNEYDGLAKIQHYVPQFILKNFSAGKKPLLWVYDKVHERKFRSNIRNLAAENGFYNIEVDGELISLEQPLSGVETKCAPIFKRIVSEKSLASLTHEERLWMSLFFSIQFIRTRANRDYSLDMFKQTREVLLNRGIPGHMLDEAGVVEPSAYEAKLMAIRDLFDANDYVEYFLQKDWVLHEAKSGRAFLISDNPISLKNDEPKDGPWGNLGLAVRGIEIYFPISPKLMLGMLCPTIKEKITRAKSLAKFIDFTIKSDDFKGHLEFIESVLNAFDYRGTIILNDENILHYNLFQILHSHKFIYSTDGEFSQVQDMIQRDPNLKLGKRGKVH